MKAVKVVLCIAVILAVVSSTYAQKRKSRNNGGGGGGGMMSKMGLTPDCIQFAKELLFDGDSVNMEKLMSLPKRFQDIFVKLMMPNPCSDLITKALTMAKSIGFGSGGAQK